VGDETAEADDLVYLDVEVSEEPYPEPHCNTLFPYGLL